MVTIGYTFNEEHFDYCIDTDDLRNAISDKIINDFGINVSNEKQAELLYFLLNTLVDSSIAVQNIFAHRYEKHLVEYFKDDAKRYFSLIRQ